ncbi:MAG: dTMP kinase [Calditrichae bacterium]|nr:dTMP kinase [Calditrichia bacterium]
MQTYKNFISFEGIDFSGKTTQIKRLIAGLKKENIEVKLVREPGGTVISEKIREILLDATYREMEAHTEILLYSAARAQLVHQKILPLLKAGEYLIADRFFDSTTTYQGYGRSLNIAFVKQLNQFATSNLVPYKTFFIDISPEEAVRRKEKAGIKSDRLESEDISFYQSIRKGFKKLCEENPERFVTIPGQGSVEEVSHLIEDTIKQFWPISE